MNALHPVDPRRVRRHAAPTIALHWLSALAVALAFAVAWTRATMDDPGPRAALMSLHQIAGLLVFGLLLARVAVRIVHWRTAPRHAMAPAVRVAALATHAALYVALLAMPLLGWALTNAHGHAVRLPGLFALPALVDADPDLAESLEAWHVGLAWAMGAAILAHAGAALYHHFIRRDNVLRSMLPRARRHRSEAGVGPLRPESRSF
jgi:cytochrome b561